MALPDASAQTERFYRPLFHFSDQVWQTHPFEVFIAAARHFMVRVLGIFLTVEGEHNVVGVKVARRFKFFAVLPLHALAQVEGIGFTVFADIPLFSQSRELLPVVPVLNSTRRL